MNGPVVNEGVLWPPGRSPWAVWVDPPSLEPVIAGERESAVVSVWANLDELVVGGLGQDELGETLEALGLDPGAVKLAGLGAPVRFLAAALGEETSRLARAALWLGSALDQSHPYGLPAEAELAAARDAAAGIGAGLGAGDLRPASARGLRWLSAALEWGGGVVEESGAAVRRRVGDPTYHAFLLGAVEDGGWPRTAECLPFPLGWCVRQAPELSAVQSGPPLAVGIVVVAAETVDQLEVRVRQLRMAYLAEGRELERPREQLALAAAMAPWAKLSRRLWRRATRSVLAGT